MEKFRNLAILALALLITGCVSRYEDADNSAPSATINFFKGFDVSYPQAGTQVYDLSEDAKCDDVKRATVISYFNSSGSIRIASGHRIAVLGATTLVTPKTFDTKPGMETVICKSTASFVAESGHVYDVAHHSSFEGKCYVDVKDEATQAPPPSLKLNAEPTCRDAP